MTHQPPPSTARARTARAGTARAGTARAADSGQITAFVAVLLLAVLAMMGLVVDGGRTLALHVHAVNEAQEAARAGAQALDLDAYRRDGTIRLDPDRAASLAAQYVAASGGTITGLRVRGDAITVSVARAESSRLLALVGQSTVRGSGTGTARAQPQLAVTPR